MSATIRATMGGEVFASASGGGTGSVGSLINDRSWIMDPFDGDRNRLRQSERQRRSLRQADFLPARRKDDGCAGAAAGRGSDEGSFLAPDECANQRPTRGWSGDFERVLLFRRGRGAANGGRVDRVMGLFVRGPQ